MDMEYSGKFSLFNGLFREFLAELFCHRNCRLSGRFLRAAWNLSHRLCRCSGLTIQSRAQLRRSRLSKASNSACPPAMLYVLWSKKLRIRYHLWERRGFWWHWIKWLLLSAYALRFLASATPSVQTITYENSLPALAKLATIFLNKWRTNRLSAVPFVVVY